MAQGRRWGVVLAVVLMTLLTPVAASAQTDYTWSGSTTSPDWSDGANWDGGVAPASPVGTLTFPDLVGPACGPGVTTDTCINGTNDLGPLTVNRIDFDGSDQYTIGAGPGASLSLGGGGIAVHQAQNLPATAALDVPLTLTAPQTWAFTTSSGYGEDNQSLTLGQPVSGDEPLTISGTTDLSDPGELPGLSLSQAEVGPVTVTGPVQLNIGTLNATDGAPLDVTSGASVRGSGAGQSGPIDVTDGELAVGQIGSATPTGSLTVNGDVSVDDRSTMSFGVIGAGATPGVNFGQLTVTGNISLQGSQFVLQQGPAPAGGFAGAQANMSFNGCEPLAGDAFPLISDPTGSITGTFADLPDGATFSYDVCDSSTREAQIHYSTHTVSVTFPNPTSTTLSAVSPAATDTPDTLTATVVGNEAPPTGTVTFFDEGAPIGNCTDEPVATTAGLAASASCTTSFAATASPASLTASFAGAGGNLDSATATPTSLPIGKGPTSTALIVSERTPTLGAPVTYTAAVQPTGAGPASPTGTVAFADDGSPIAGCAAQPVGSGGTATCTTSYQQAGPHSITGTYGGDANFTTSTTAAQTVVAIAASGQTGAPRCSPTAGRARVGGSRATVVLGARTGGASCTVTVKLTSHRRRGSGRHRAATVIYGSATVTVKAGHRRSVAVRLDARGRRLVARQRHLKLGLEVIQRLGRTTTTVASRSVTFRAAARR